MFRTAETPPLALVIGGWSNSPKSQKRNTVIISQPPITLPLPRCERPFVPQAGKMAFQLDSEMKEEFEKCVEKAVRTSKRRFVIFLIIGNAYKYQLR